MLLFILATAFYIADAQSISRITMQPMNVIYVVDTATTTGDISSKWEKVMVDYLWLLDSSN